jgi:hypothetical protein
VIAVDTIETCNGVSVQHPMKLGHKAHSLTIEQKYLHLCGRACSSISESNDLGHVSGDGDSDIHGNDGRMAWNNLCSFGIVVQLCLVP